MKITIKLVKDAGLHKVKAIKAVRALSGLGLKASKDLVEFASTVPQTFKVLSTMEVYANEEIQNLKDAGYDVASTTSMEVHRACILEELEGVITSACERGDFDAVELLIFTRRSLMGASNG